MKREAYTSSMGGSEVPKFLFMPHRMKVLAELIQVFILPN